MYNKKGFNAIIVICVSNIISLLDNYINESI